MEQLDKQGKHREADTLLKQSGKLNDWAGRFLDKTTGLLAPVLDRMPSSKLERQMDAKFNWRNFAGSMEDKFLSGNVDAMEGEIFQLQREFGKDIVKFMIDKIEMDIRKDFKPEQAFDKFVADGSLKRMADQVASEASGLSRAEAPTMKPTGASLTQTFPQSEQNMQQARMTEPLDERNSVGVSA